MTIRGFPKLPSNSSQARGHEVGHHHVSTPAQKHEYPKNALEMGNCGREINRGVKVLSYGEGKQDMQLAVEMPRLERFSQSEH